VSSSTPALVEAFLAARVLALNSGDLSAYDQGSRSARFTEVDTPLSVAQGGDFEAHLAFDVWAQDGPNTDRIRGRGVGSANDFCRMDLEVPLAFLYQLRDTTENADARLAWDVAVLIARAVMAEQTAGEVSTYGGINVELANLGRPALTPDGRWLLMRQVFRAQFNLDLVV
jgi:hypothetical protein